jgi:hypothetical protein
MQERLNSKLHIKTTPILFVGYNGVRNKNLSQHTRTDLARRQQCVDVAATNINQPFQIQYRSV